LQEVIGDKHSFLTGKKWGCTPEIDQEHWARFAEFRRLLTLQPARPASQSGLVNGGEAVDDGLRSKLPKSPFIFMRWKVCTATSTSGPSKATTVFWGAGPFSRIFF